MKNIVKLVVILTLISAICTAILAAVNSVTREPIAQSKEKRILEAARKVLPEGAAPAAVTCVVDGRSITGFVARDAAGKVTGVALQGTSSKGYGGPVTIMFGLVDGKLYNYEVIAHTETPGLGAKIGDEPFRSGVLKNSDGSARALAGTNWQVKKDGGDIEAITAATISSRATLEALRGAIADCQAITASLEQGK